MMPRSRRKSAQEKLTPQEKQEWKDLEKFYQETKEDLKHERDEALKTEAVNHKNAQKELRKRQSLMLPEK